jgi:cyclopropane fatty-acyl-phospholipid synthase-like methyltransferase
MLSLNLGRLLGRTEASPVAEPLRPSDTPHSVPAVPAMPSGPWPPERQALTDRLWGPGFNIPGGEEEILRLARPTGASADNRMLMIGMGGGGAATAVVRSTHTWVTGMEAEPELLAAARARAEADHLGRRVAMESWDPSRPVFPKGAHRNCLALEPMRQSVCSVVLPALAATIERGGNLVVTDLISTEPINVTEPMVARWVRLDLRDPAVIPTAGAVAAVMDACGMDLRIAEDISQRHMDQTLQGWQRILDELVGHKPTPREAAFVVSEAELWLLRHRLIETGRLRMMRWHAIKTR